MELHGYRLEVKGQRLAVPDGVAVAVARHVAGLVLRGPEGAEGVLVGAVDWRSREAEEERIGQGGAHLLPQVSLLGPVGLVDHDDDVVALVQDSIHFAELEDRCDEDLPRVCCEEGRQFLLTAGGGHVGDIRRVEVTRYLILEVDSVIDDYHGRVLELRRHPQLLSREDHKE